MKKKNRWLFLLMVSFFFLAGCTAQLDKKKQTVNDKGVSYEFQLPYGWKADQTPKAELGLQTTFSAEDTKSNSYLFITSVPVATVKQEGFGEQTREKLKERYNYKNVKDVYMKKTKIGKALAYKYTLNTLYQEKSVWAHFYYIWTEHSFVQLTFYSADDNSYKKRSEKIDASVATFKEVNFDAEEAEKQKVQQKKEEGDVITIENQELKFETTAVRKLTGSDQKKMLAIRYTFTNKGAKTAQPALWKSLVTATQNEQRLSLGDLPQDTSFLDVKELLATQETEVKPRESVESVVLYELTDDSTIELSFSQEAFPKTEPARVVIPK